MSGAGHRAEWDDPGGIKWDGQVSQLADRSERDEARLEQAPAQQTGYQLGIIRVCPAARQFLRVPSVNQEDSHVSL